MDSNAVRLDDGNENARDGEPASAARLRRIGWLAGVVLLAALIAIAVREAEPRALIGLMRAARPRWLLVAVLLQLLTYVCAAAVWQRALVRQGVRSRLRSLLPLGLAKLFTDQVVPSAGMSGTLLVVRGLERRGVSRTGAVAAMLTGLVAYYLGYLAAMVAAAVWMALHGELRLVVLLPLVILGSLAVALPISMIVLRKRAQRGAPRWLSRWPGARDVSKALREAPAGSLFAPRLLAETTLLQLVIFALDALTLDATLRALAVSMPLAVVFASFVLASAVSSLAWIPGGLGTFEGSCVALLHLHGISIESALAATLLLRGLSFWLPMLPGFTLARRELGKAAVRGVAR